MEQRQLVGGVLASFGAVLVAIQATHSVQQTDIPAAIAIDAVPFVVMGLALVYAGYWLATEPTFEETAVRVGAWCGGGTVVFAAVASLLLFGQQVTTGTLTRAFYLTLDLVTVGALVGVLTGIYDARSRNRFRELKAERDRTEAFAEKAANVNNYGRVIHNARGIDEIAGYVVEAFETLLGIHECAVVQVRDDRIELVASTVQTLDTDSVRELATESLDQPPGDVVTHSDSLPVDADVDETADVLTARLGETEETPTVIVSVTGNEPIREEDEKLLELVAAHASESLVDVRAVA